MIGRGTQDAMMVRAEARPAGIRYRMLALKLALLLSFVGIALRLVQIQVIRSAGYKEIARRQSEARVVLPATRGSIFDRNGKLLVSNTQLISFGADPKMIGERAEALADRFASVFGKSKESYLAKLSIPGRRFVWLERRVKPQFSKRINAKDFDGLVEMEEPQRLYPFESLAAQLIGFTDIDNHGLSGIELELDAQLKGTDGEVIMQRDGLGRTYPSLDYPRVDPVNGRSVVLTIDLEYQAIAEAELSKGVERNQAESGLVVMMDPATGEILAMANYPPLDPAHVPADDPASSRNRAVSDMFEPGSVFKVVTASAALEENVVKPGQKFFGEHGKYAIRLAGGKERIITDTHDLGMVTFEEAMEYSSNIVMAKISDLVGAEKMFTTARDFGFGTSAGTGLPGEADGELKRPTEWSGTTLNSMAYGYEVAVTPLQIACAYAALANKGILMKPFVVKGILDAHNQPVSETEPQVVRRAVPPAVAQTMTRILEGVVEQGTGLPARVPGIRIAGKTGTSRKYSGGRYQPGSYTASFVGFFPADDPKVVCLVMLDDPKAGGYTGGLASAPIFRAIAQKIYTISGRFARKPPVVLASQLPVALPDVTAMAVTDAEEMLGDQGFDVQVRGKGTVVQDQNPAPGTVTRRHARVVLETEDADGGLPDGYARVPELRRLPLRKAVTRLALEQLEASIHGSGLVVAQTPPAGTRVKAGTNVQLRCEPRQNPETAQWF